MKRGAKPPGRVSRSQPPAQDHATAAFAAMDAASAEFRDRIAAQAANELGRLRSKRPKAQTRRGRRNSTAKRT